MRYEMGEANQHAIWCLGRLRFLSCLLKDRIRQEGLWEDMIQELYVTAFQACKTGLDINDTRKAASNSINHFLQSYGWRTYRHHYFKVEKCFAAVCHEQWQEDSLQPVEGNQNAIFFGGEDLQEPILKFLKTRPECITRAKICARLQVSMYEVEWYLTALVKKGYVVSVERENWLGRPQSPLLLIAGLPLPKAKKNKAEEMERIRHAHFAEGKSIKCIAREFHHDRRIIRRAIRELVPAGVS